MHEIENLTNSPYDLESVSGVVHLPARGTVKGTFSDEMLIALSGCGLYEVVPLKGHPLDHDGDGRKGGAKSPDNKAAGDDILAAIDLLDPKDDNHWTAAGLPAVGAVSDLAGKAVTRADINAVAPDAKRP